MVICFVPDNVSRITYLIIQCNRILAIDNNCDSYLGFLLAIASLNNFFNSPFLSLAMTGSANTSKIERIVLTYLFMEYTVFTRR